MNTLDLFRLDQKIAVITGGAGLLGVKHAEALLEAGANVCLLDINMESLNQKAEELSKKFPGKVAAFKVDICKEMEICDALEKIQARFHNVPDILINNAAIDPKVDRSSKMPASRLEGFSVEQWNVELAVGLTGSMLCAKIFGEAMAKKKSGVILNVASDLGLIAPDQRLYRKEGLADEEQNVKPVTYSVIKHGLIGLTKYIASYWADKGVRCNAFAPGGVQNNQPEEFLQKISKLIPMGRMAHVDEYKGAVLFMVSGASSYMNGAIVSVDGGRTVW